MKKGSGVSGLLGLLVFALLAMCLLGTLLAGAAGYKRMVAAGEERFADDTAARYLAVRVRQAEQVQIETFGGLDALVLPETIEGWAYVTRVYCMDGYLWELFSDASAELEPADGEKLIPLESLRFSWAGEMLSIQVNGRQLYLLPRQGRQVQP